MRPSLRAFFLVGVLLAASAALSGCFGASDVSLRVVPYAPVNTGAPGRASDFAFYVENWGSFREDAPVSAWGLPEGWKVTFNNDSLQVRGDRGGRYLVATVTPPANATFGYYPFHVKVGEADVVVGLRLMKLDAAPVLPGMGAQVRLLGFYDNGTVFSNSLQEARANGDLRKGLLGNESDVSMLRVYVDDGIPNGSAEGFAAAGYRRLVPGLTEALVGLHEGETRVVRVAPSKGHALQGNATHVLGNKALNYLLIVESVDAVPVAAPASRCPAPACVG